MAISSSDRSDPKPRRFQADLVGRSIDLVVEHSSITFDGRTVPFSCKRVSDHQLSLLIDGKSYDAIVVDEANGTCRVQLGGREYEVRLKSERDLLLERFGLAEETGGGIREIRAPMPGLVLSVTVAAGQEVSARMGLVVLEAMKMENEIRADQDGIVKAVHVAPGAAVGKNDLLVELE